MGLGLPLELALLVLLPTGGLWRKLRGLGRKLRGLLWELSLRLGKGLPIVNLLFRLLVRWLLAIIYSIIYLSVITQSLTTLLLLAEAL
jgi:hypothetical protein